MRSRLTLHPAGDGCGILDWGGVLPSHSFKARGIFLDPSLSRDPPRTGEQFLASPGLEAAEKEAARAGVERLGGLVCLDELEPALRAPGEEAPGFLHVSSPHKRPHRHSLAVAEAAGQVAGVLAEDVETERMSPADSTRWLEAARPTG